MASKNFLNTSLPSPEYGILLRNPEVSDVEAFIEILGNPANTEMDKSVSQYKPSVEKQTAIILKMRASATETPLPRLNLVVVDTATDKVVGLGGYGHISNLPDGKKIGDVGVMLLPEVRGRGIGLEAMKLAIRFGFEELGFDEVTACMEARNVAMRKIMDEKLKWVGKEQVDENGTQEMSYVMTKAQWAESGGF